MRVAPPGPRVTSWEMLKSPTSSRRCLFRSIPSSDRSSISCEVKPGSIRTYFSDRYSRSTCSFIRKLAPPNVRIVSNT